MPRNTDTTAATEWHILQKAIRVKQYNLNPIRCKQCQSPIPYETRNTQTFCSRSCSTIFNNLSRGHKANGAHTHNLRRECKNCQKTIMSMKYCSHKCQREYAAKLTIEMWQADKLIVDSEYVPNAVRRFLLDEAGHKCSVCGWDKINPTTNKCPLTIDHIDGNVKNHKRNNLRVLCPCCHSLTPTYCALNKGSGRKRRYKTKDV